VFETALLPLHLQESAQRVDALVRMLRSFGTARIVLLHVVSSGLGNVRHARSRLEAARQRMASEWYETDWVVRSGSPALEITRAADEREAQVIAIPWKRKNVLQRTLLGSVSQDVVRLSSLPVFVHKTQTVSGRSDVLDTILYATTFDATHERIKDYLRHEHLAASHLHVLHVGARAPDPEAEHTRRQEVFAELNRFQALCEACFDTVKSHTTVGKPKPKILQFARQVGADLIVIGKHSQPRPLDNLLGSTAEAITHRSRCSVLIVPAGDSG